jgi:hypothetical protein
MCSICDDLKTKKINSKEAFKAIGDALRSADKKTTRHLMELSDRIIDSEVPMPDRDEVVDGQWEDEYKD